VLTYNITSNHVHLIAYAEDAPQVSETMQRAAGNLEERQGRHIVRALAFSSMDRTNSSICSTAFSSK